MNKTSAANMTLRYLIALGLLAALSIAAFLILRGNISSQETNAAVVNVSGRQRMLSQQTALLAHELIHGSASASGHLGRAALRGELLDTIGLMEKSHDGLVNGDPGMNLPGEPSAEVRAMYFEPPLLVDSQVRNFLAEAKALAQAPDAELTSDNPHLEYIEANVAAVLGALNAMVEQYQKESESDVAGLQGLELWVLGATLFVLLISALFIFRPMVRHIRQKMIELNTLNATLERRVQDRTGRLSAVNKELERDISERKRAEEALRNSEERYRALVETSPDVIYTISPDGTLTSLNPAFETITGWSCAEWIGKNFAPVIHPDDRPLAVDVVQRLLREEEVPPTTELRVVTKSGEYITGEFASTLQMQKGRVVGVLGIVRDISERKRAEEELRRLNEELGKDQQEIEALNRSLERRVKERTQKLRLANQEMQERNRQLLDARAQAATDALTGLCNHRAFQERVRDEVSHAQANGNSLGLIMLDIDGFKGVNDSLGHQAGDDILRLLAQVLTDVVRWEDAYRYGGDEFAVLLPGADSHKAARIAQRLRRAVAKRTGANGAKVTVSLGIADFPHTADSAEQLIYGADAAMYWAKAAGKDRVGDWAKLLKHGADGTLPSYAGDRGVRAPDVIAAFVAALAAKDPDTAAHTERCSWYVLKLAEELGLDEDETPIVRLASLLQDIGKLVLPDEVLFKPGSLNEDEWALMKQHPTSALHLLQIRSIADAAPAVLHHHEHFDGSGYPDGLAGDDIPLASRILLVTDAFDAMTTDRPYRKAMPVEAAIEELKRNSGSQFDPAIVEAFLRILARHGAQPLRSARSAATKAAATVRTG